MVSQLLILGYLTNNEFYNLIRTFDVHFTLDEFQRISQLVVSHAYQGKICIQSILDKHRAVKKGESKVQEGLCDVDVFKKTLQRFDPTLQLFKKWTDLKKAETKFLKYLNENKDRIRG